MRQGINAKLATQNVAASGCAVHFMQISQSDDNDQLDQFLYFHNFEHEANDNAKKTLAQIVVGATFRQVFGSPFGSCFVVPNDFAFMY